MRNPGHFDALCWSVLSALLLLLLPIGHVSPDGLGQSHLFSAGFTRWNPNHLLVEPLGSWWMGLIDPASRAEAVDHLRRLSILSGSIAVGLFRFGVARRLTATRLSANQATAWLAFSSAFLRLWVLDEVYMTQMPAVVGVAWLVLRYLEKPSFSKSVAVGASVALAAAFFIQNLLLGPALALALLKKKPRHAAGILIGMLAAVPVFVAASPTPDVLHWITSYGGGNVPPRVELAYGMNDLWMSVARALYGSACALVDLAPLVAMFRDLSDLNLWPAGAFLAGTLALLAGLRTSSRPALLLFGVWAAAVLGFGIYWNNSDDQFYVQLAVPFAALAASLPLRSKAAVLGMLALLFNLVDVASRRIFYPREERLATIEREFGDAGLILYPGFDEMEVLLALKPVAPAASFTDYSVRMPAEEGLEDLLHTIFGVLSEGRSVAVVDTIDVAPTRSPWKFLARMGYDHAKVVDMLDSFALEPVPERPGPFTVRWIRGRSAR